MKKPEGFPGPRPSDDPLLARLSALPFLAPAEGDARDSGNATLRDLRPGRGRSVLERVSDHGQLVLIVLLLVLLGWDLLRIVRALLG